MINFDEEIARFKQSLEISAVEDAVIQSDLTDMNDIIMEMLKKQIKEQD